VETLLTPIETCRQQSRDVFAFVTKAVEALHKSDGGPSLRCEPLQSYLIECVTSTIRTCIWPAVER